MELENAVIYFLFIGAGGTLLLDVWAVFASKVLKIPATDWALVGRWFVHMSKGKFIHQHLSSAAQVPFELQIGWTAHYIIGILYGLPIWLFWGESWLESPTLMPPMLVSWVLLAAPFFIMMPGMGAGVAGLKTPRPHITQIKSLVGHSMFGLGMYVSAQIIVSLVLLKNG